MNRHRVSLRRMRHRPDRRRSRGFTLIELMIVCAVIGVLAAIAYPSYQDSVWKSKRAEAKAAIMRTLQTEERHYTQANTYLGYAQASPPANSAFPAYSGDGASGSHYTIEVAATGNNLCGNNNLVQCAVVTARIIGTNDPKCGATLSADTAGGRYPPTTAVAPADVCWK